MARLAFMTSGVLLAPYGDPRVQGLVDRTPAAFAAAEASVGFIARSYEDAVAEANAWGEWAAPAIFRGAAYQDRVPETLSLWRDLESVFAFIYSGVHTEALGKRKDWFEPARWPTHAAWWVPDPQGAFGSDHTPTWQEACERYDRLRQAGASPEAFDFKQPFGPDGQPAKIDRDAVKRLSLQYQRSRPSSWPAP